jgi:hypothetical protein
MKSRYEYSLIFIVIHVLLTAAALKFFYEPNIPNGDLGMIMFPNILIPLLLTDNLPDIFGYFSNLYWATIFWAVVGSTIGLIVEKIKSRKLSIQ